jgi:glutamate dehydrogenase/leucine dehydrogenase
MIANGMEVVSCGANVQFIDDQVFFGPTAHYADAQLSVLPDFVANCGMARVFAYLMQHDIEVTDEAIFNDVSATIRQALIDIRTANDSKTHISTTALEIALKKLVG